MLTADDGEETSSFLPQRFSVQFLLASSNAAALHSESREHLLIQRISFSSFEYVAAAELLMASDLSTYLRYAWLVDCSDVTDWTWNASENITIIKSIIFTVMYLVISKTIIIFNNAIYSLNWHLSFWLGKIIFTSTTMSTI